MKPIRVDMTTCLAILNINMTIETHKYQQVSIMQTYIYKLKTTDKI